jgi:hypothetical protein
MKAAYGIYAGLAVLALGGGWLYLSRLDKQNRAAAHAGAATPETLPPIALAPGDAERLTKLELARPDDDHKSKIQTVTLEKHGLDWEMTAPLKTKASTSKVAALIDNLENLHLWKIVDTGTARYEAYDLTEGKALHVVAWKGPDKVTDLFCGKSSPQGQLTRIAGKDGVFALVNWGPQGYAGFLYTRDVRSWRETSILKFNEDDAIRIEITNPNGRFLFSRGADGWTGSFSKRHQNGNGDSGSNGGSGDKNDQGDQPGPAWRGFDPSRIKDLLRAYEALDADDFGDEDDRTHTGVDRAERTGGVIRIQLKNAAADLVMRIGAPTLSNSRWAIKDSRWAVKDGGDGTLYALSPWTAGWATAPAGQFEKTSAAPPPAARRP